MDSVVIESVKKRDQGKYKILVSMGRGVSICFLDDDDLLAFIDRGKEPQVLRDALSEISKLEDVSIVKNWSYVKNKATRVIQ